MRLQTRKALICRACRGRSAPISPISVRYSDHLFAAPRHAEPRPASPALPLGIRLPELRRVCLRLSQGDLDSLQLSAPCLCLILGSGKLGLRVG